MTKIFSALFRKKWFLTLVSALSVLLAFYLIHLPHGPEHWSADLRTKLWSEQLPKQYERIALVEITNTTLESFPYVSPINRHLLAELIKTVDSAGPTAIGLDLIFDRPSEVSNDNELMQAIQSTRAPIVLGAIDDETPTNSPPTYQKKFLEDAQQRAQSRVRVGHLYLGEERGNPLVVSEHVIRKIAEPSGSQAGRRSFAEVLAKLDESPHDPVDEGREIAWLRHPKGAKTWYSWLWSPESDTETFLTLPAELIIAHEKNGPSLPNLLGGKFVLIGGNFPDRDQHLTPMSVWSDERFTGLSIQAQILAQLLRNAHVYELRVLHDHHYFETRNPLTYYSLAILIAVFAAGVFAGRRDRSGHSELIIEILGVAVLIVISVVVFAFIRPPYIFPFVSALLAWLAGLAGGHYTRMTRADKSVYIE
jgi:adenylate cyclase